MKTPHIGTRVDKFSVAIDESVITYQKKNTFIHSQCLTCQFRTGVQKHLHVIGSEWFKHLACTCTCVAIHPERVEPASPIALTMCRTEALQARRFCSSSLDTFTQSFLHRAWPKTRGPERGSMLALIVVAHVFSWPPAFLRHVRGGVGRRRSLISSPFKNRSLIRTS